MKKIGKRMMSLLCAAVMLLSLVAVPGISAQAAEGGTLLDQKLSGIDEAHIINYFPSYDSEDNFRTGYGVMSDADAANETAFYFGDANLTAAHEITITRYDVGTSKQLPLAVIPASEVKIDAGYQVYKFVIDVPSEEMTDNAYVYFLKSWQVQSPKLARDLAQKAGKTVELYLSMKVTGTVENATLYIDRMALVDSCQENISAEGYCAVCGKAIKSITITANDFVVPIGTDGIVVDADSTVGKAAKFSYADRFASGDAGLYNGMIVSDSGLPITMRRYTAGEFDTSIDVGTISAEELNANATEGGYKIYKFANVELMPVAGANENFIYMFGWGLQAWLNNYAAFLEGKKVDVSLSMKVTGDVTNTTDNTPTYYIDKIIIDIAKPEDPLAIELNAVHSAHVIKYDQPNNEDHFRGGYGSVEDEDAANGIAYHMGDANLTSTHAINIRRFDAATSTFVEIGALDASAVKMNQGFCVYKFTVDVPSENLNDGGYVYFLTSWQVQCFQLSDDMMDMAGKTVDIYVSMKATGESTNANLYFDYVAMVDHCEDCVGNDGYCTKCGEKVNDVEPEVTEPEVTEPEKDALLEELDAVNSAHKISSDDATNEYHFRAGYGSVADEEAFGGNAYHMGDANLTGAQKIEITRYDDVYGKLTIGTLDASEVKMNKGYQLYKFTVEVPAEGLGDGGYVYFLASWQVQSVKMADDLKAMAGKTVDVYLSMKVTGETTANTSIYIDRVVLVDHCEDNVGNDGNCTKCGENVVPTPVTSWNLTLDGNIGINFVLNVTAEQATTANVDVTIAGVTETKSVAGLVNGEGKAVLTVELAAAQMTDEVTIALHVDGQTISNSYTVRQYADVILTGDYTDVVKAVVKEMLNYGAASQTYFNYNSTNLANAGIEITPSVPTGESKMDVTGSANGVKFYGASMVHENKITVRFYFTADSIDGITFNVNGVAVTPESKNNMYYVELTDICPQDLDEAITVTVSDGTDTLTVTYAPMDYIIRMYNKANASDTTKAVVQALYGYYMVAEAYAAV